MEDILLDNQSNLILGDLEQRRHLDPNSIFFSHIQIDLWHLWNLLHSKINKH